MGISNPSTNNAFRLDNTTLKPRVRGRSTGTTAGLANTTAGAGSSVAGTEDPVECIAVSAAPAEDPVVRIVCAGEEKSGAEDPVEEPP
jgi:hypothetical protein